VKLALWQCRPSDGRIEAALDALAGQLTAAAAAGAGILVVPELYLPGYNRPDLHESLAQPLDGEWISRIRTMARRASCGVCLGWAERDGDDVFNVATLIGPDGRILLHYRKIQLFGGLEERSFARGAGLADPVEIDGRRIGLLICYDIEFPGHAGSLGQAGVDVILVPTANPVGYDHVPGILVPARAHENDAVVAYANLVGPEGDITFGGRSVIAGPDGRPLAAAGGRGEALLVVDLAAADAVPPEGHSNRGSDYRPAS
jgi:predicted amidohydrolase